MPDYIYQSLPSAKTHIRLLTLLPHSNAGHIAIALKAVPLSDAAGKYDAISYAWGPSEPVYEVLVDGQRLWLQENIWRFLKQCSSTSLGDKLIRPLWIDSICINQKNVPEKNQQVKQMATIYSRAKQAIVWLGEASRTSVWADYAFERYDRMRDFLFDAYSRRKAPENNDAAVKTNLRQIMTSTYWTRLWIVQELALAHTVAFVSGTDLCDLNAFWGIGTLMSHFFQVEDTGSEDVAWKSASKQVDRLVERHFARETQSPYRGLASLVEEFADQQCKDPHDHVYGLLGLLDSKQGEDLVDYDRDMEVLFWNVLEVTHQQMSAVASGARRDSYQWNMETLLSVLQLRLQDVFAHKALQDRMLHDRFAVEMKNNGRVIPPAKEKAEKAGLMTSPNVALFSLIVSWYYYGDLSILVSSDLAYATLAYVSDPLNEAYAGDIFGSSVDTHVMNMSDCIRRDLMTSMQYQNMTYESLVNMAKEKGSLSVPFSFTSLVELSRLSAIGNEYFQPAEQRGGAYISRAREWPGGIPWQEVMSKAEAARASIPTLP